MFFKLVHLPFTMYPREIHNELIMHSESYLQHSYILQPFMYHQPPNTFHFYMLFSAYISHLICLGCLGQLFEISILGLAYFFLLIYVIFYYTYMHHIEMLLMCMIIFKFYMIWSFKINITHFNAHSPLTIYKYPFSQYYIISHTQVLIMYSLHNSFLQGKHYDLDLNFSRYILIRKRFPVLLRFAKWNFFSTYTINYIVTGGDSCMPSNPKNCINVMKHNNRMRLCNYCGNYGYHDARNCPERKNYQGNAVHQILYKEIYAYENEMLL